MHHPIPNLEALRILARASEYDLFGKSGAQVTLPKADKR